MSTIADLLIPFRFGDDPHRDRAWSWVRAWYKARHPRFRVIVGTCPDDRAWSKGHAVAQAAKRSKADVIVVADADLVVDPKRLDATVGLVMAGDAAWAQPHGMVYRLSRRATQVLLDGRLQVTTHPPDRWMLDRAAHPGPPGGGVVALTREAFDATGGIDPRFVGFGGDDISWARALDTLAGPGARGDGDLWHLYHPKTPRRPGNRGSATNEALAGRYLDAEYDEEAMRRLVAEHAGVSA